MAVDESVTRGEEELRRSRKRTFGIGLLKGMRVTIKHLFKHNTVIEYPDERRVLPARTRGVIALKEENCTVCMLCGRECPCWCIYIDSHKETLPPKRAGGRQRKRNVLDRFAIDYAICMYCGICVEVCPYDALFWSPEFEYSEFDIRQLTHEKERLSDWMASVKPPPPLEQGAELPGTPAAEPLAAGAAGPGSAQRPAPPTAITAGQERPEQTPKATAPAPSAAPAPSQATPSQQQAGETSRATAGAPTEEKISEPAPAAAAPVGAAGPDTDAIKTPTEATDSRTAVVRDEQPAAAQPAGPSPPPVDVERYQETPGPNVEVPHEEPHPVALERTEDPEVVYRDVLEEQLEKGSSPQVAEARAKVARVKAERGIRRAATPAATDEPVASAPSQGHPVAPEPSGAPEAEGPKPEPGPVAPRPDEEPGT